MRVRIVRETYPDENREMLVVQKWVPKAPSLEEAWQHVLNFFPHEYDEAMEFAMKLSMSKESATQEVVFEDGVPFDDNKLDSKLFESGFCPPEQVKPAPIGCDPNGSDHSYNSVSLGPTP